MRRAGGIGVAAVVGTVLRWAVVLATRPYPLGSDAGDYDRLGRLIASGHGFGESIAAQSGPTSFRPPAYPIFLAAIYRVTGDSITAARLVQAVLGGVSIVLIGVLAARLCDRRAGVAAAAIAAVYPPLVIASTALLSEALFIPLELAALWFAYRFRDGRRPADLVVASVAAGLGVLTRPVGVVVVAVVMVIVSGAGAPASTRLRRALASGVLAVVVVVPWLVRDYDAFDAFVPVSTLDGFNLGGTYNDVAASDPPFSRYAARPANLVPELRPVIAEHLGDELGMSEALRRSAFDHIRQNPTAPIEAIAWNSYRLLGFGGFDITKTSIRLDDGYGSALAWAAFLSFPPVMVAAVGGAFRARREAMARQLLLVAAGLWLLTVVVLGHARLRGSIEPFVVLFAGLASAAGIGAWTERRTMNRL